MRISKYITLVYPDISQLYPFNILICYPFGYPPTASAASAATTPTSPEPAPPPPTPTPPVVRNRLCWPGDRRWNKNQLLTPLMSRFDVLTLLVTRAR